MCDPEHHRTAAGHRRQDVLNSSQAGKHGSEDIFVLLISAFTTNVRFWREQHSYCGTWPNCPSTPSSDKHTDVRDNVNLLLYIITSQNSGFWQYSEIFKYTHTHTHKSKTAASSVLNMKFCHS